MAKKRQNETFFDETAAFSRALDYKFSKDVYVTPDLKKFLDLKGIQHAVDSKMFLPGFLVSTSNVMGMAKVEDIYEFVF